jgi:TonB family protein
MPVDEIPPIVRVPPPEEQPPERMEGVGESREVPQEETAEIREQPSQEARRGEEPSPSQGPDVDIGPEQLFDEDVIQEFAKVEPRKEERADDPITFDTQGFRYKGYKRMLWDKLQWALDNNPLPFRVPKGTRVAIRFTIRKDGSLEKLEIISPSGYKAYDEYTVNVFQDEAPFWPLPESWQKEKFYYSTYVEFVGARSIFIIR